MSARWQLATIARTSRATLVRNTNANVRSPASSLAVKLAKVQKWKLASAQIVLQVSLNVRYRKQLRCNPNTLLSINEAVLIKFV